MKLKTNTFEIVVFRSFTLALALIFTFFSIFSPSVVAAKGFFGFLGVSYNESGDLARSLTPSEGNRRPARVMEVVATAYSSTPDQTDDSPFLSANGTYVYDGMIAANFLPFGTLVRFPDTFGDKIFRVDDRMNARYGNGRLDIWMTSRGAAKKFGVKRMKMEIVGRQYKPLATK